MDWLSIDSYQHKSTAIDDYLISRDEGEDAKQNVLHDEEDNECFYDCSQMLEDFTFMPATTTSAT